MKITIDLSQLTPEQAFEIGKLSAAKVEQPTQPAEPKATRAPRSSNSQRFKSTVAYSDSFIAELVKLKKDQGANLQQIADKLNAENVKTANGKKFWGSTVWDIVYSKQAMKMWLN
jgi:cytoplasmic iron level regulating protein YaaA (DUF328/UPF0246 family)